MATDRIVVTCITDTRQLAREAAMLTPADVNDYLAGRLPVWPDHEQDGMVVIITPRLCFG